MLNATERETPLHQTLAGSVKIATFASDPKEFSESGLGSRFITTGIDVSGCYGNKRNIACNIRTRAADKSI
jgi:hypothetical protein